jgi:hypothetical protein
MGSRRWLASSVLFLPLACGGDDGSGGSSAGSESSGGSSASTSSTSGTSVDATSSAEGTSGVDGSTTATEAGTGSASETGAVDSSGSGDESGTTGQVNDATDWVTYLGGGQFEQVRDVAVDGEGNIYVAGGTGSPGFPTTVGAYDESHNGNVDVFVTKFAPDGSLVWSTFVGGANYDRAYAIEIDDQGHVYAGGRAGAGFPTTAGVVQEAFGGDNAPNQLYGTQDGFVLELEPDGGALVWSTYFGSSDHEVMRDFDVDGDGEVYVAMTSIAVDHPHATAGAFQPARDGGRDGFVAKLSADASTVVWGSYFGGGADDGETPSIRVDDAGNAFYLTHTQSNDAPATAGAYQTTLQGGVDLIVARIAQDGGSLVWCSYVGGSMTEFTETHGLSIDGNGRAVVTATTTSPNLPMPAGAYQGVYGGTGGGGMGGGTNYPGDGFVWRLSADGSELEAGTFLGGSAGEGIEGSGVDAMGNVYVTGSTFSDDFPASAGAFQSSKGAGADQFVAKLAPDLDALVHASYVGGSGSEDFARSGTVDGFGNVYVIGQSNGDDFPVTADAYDATFGGGTADGTVARLIGTAN